MATKFSRMLIRIIGAISLALSCWGFYYLADAGRRVLIYPVNISGAPFFKQMFWAMNGLNAACLVFMAIVSVGLLRVKNNAVRVYGWIYIALVVITFAPGLFWGGGALGSSIAAASGIGGLAIAPLILFPIPFVYAVVSVVLVNIAARKIRGTSSDTLPSQAV